MRDPWKDSEWAYVGKRRDSFKSRCYRAEDPLLRHPSNVWFRGILDCRLHLCNMYRGPMWDSLGLPPVMPNLLRSTKPNSFAFPRQTKEACGDMYLNEAQMCLAILLHELAHSTISGGHGHDERWQTAYVILVTVFMGREAGELLIENFARM